jgi:hypothetical protein
MNKREWGTDCPAMAATWRTSIPGMNCSLLREAEQFTVNTTVTVYSGAFWAEAL